MSESNNRNTESPSIHNNDEETGATPSTMPAPPQSTNSSTTSTIRNAEHDDALNFRRLEPRSFPDTVGEGNNIKILATIKNVDHVLLEHEIQVSYNVITKRVDIIIPGMESTTTNVANTTYAQTSSLMKLNQLGTEHLSNYLGAIADSNQSNPVMKWINSEEWDRVDRLAEFYRTLIVREDFPVEIRNMLLLRWMISAVAAASMPSGFRCRGVLTLQGAQSIGKTSWFLSLISDPMLREKVLLVDHLLDPGNKDSKIEAISHWIVEIGEVDSTFKRDIARLKGYLTAPNDKIRQPYAKSAAEYPRKTVFGASVNSEEFLVDSTGNTRFWSLPVVEVNYEHGLNMQQVWAQVEHIFRVERERWWLLKDEEAKLEALNKNHRAVSVVREAIDDGLDFDAPKHEWKRMAPSALLRLLEFKNPSNAQARECGEYLRELFGQPTSSRGSKRWLVPPLHGSRSNYTPPPTVKPTNVDAPPEDIPLVMVPVPPKDPKN